jgi:hypothetical protein
MHTLSKKAGCETLQTTPQFPPSAIGSTRLQAGSTDGFARSAAVAVLLWLAVQCAAAAWTYVALHGDGAWFIFTLAVDQPWALKWSILANRSAVYATVVLPAELLTNELHLTGLQIAALYGFLFNFVQLVQFSICFALAWRRHASLLLFPAAQFAFGNVLGFGFMSEMLVGPGFFWICFFLALRPKLPVLWFALCFAGIFFSHELAIPSALLVAVFAWSRRGAVGERRLSNRDFALVALCSSVIAGWVALRLAGGGEGVDNPLATLDPRRLVNNPTLWLLCPAIAALAVSSRVWTGRRVWMLAIIALTGVLMPLLLRPWLNFAQGRYDSARTIIGGGLFFFGFWAIATVMDRFPRHWPARARSIEIVTPAALTMALAINIGASLAFLLDWSLSLDSFLQLAQGDSARGVLQPVQVIPYSQAEDLLNSDQKIANRRMSMEWAWPYRFVVIGADYRPAIIAYGTEGLHSLCGPLQRLNTAGGIVPADVVHDLAAISCSAAPASPRRGFVGRTFDRVKTIWAGSSGAPTPGNSAKLP